MNSVAVYLKETGSGEALIDAFRQQFSRDGQFVIYSNRSLRTRVFEIFDQTFAVTYVLADDRGHRRDHGNFSVPDDFDHGAFPRAGDCPSDRRKRGAGPETFALGNRDARGAGRRDRRRVRPLPFACAHWCDQSRVLWLDDPAGVSVALPRADALLDFCGGGGRRHPAGLAGGADWCWRRNCGANEDESSTVAASLCERCDFVASRFAAQGDARLAADCEKTAEPGWRYEFPRDHHVHPDFKTEWWYFTGNLFDDEGRRFGYELTFFRQGIRPLAERNPDSSRFIVGDLKFAHFALTDVSKRRFHFEQKTSRGAFGEAGFDDGKRLAWIDNWTLASNGDDAFDLMASESGGRDSPAFARDQAAGRARRKRGQRRKPARAGTPRIIIRSRAWRRRANSSWTESRILSRRELVRSRVGDRPARREPDRLGLDFVCNGRTGRN